MQRRLALVPPPPPPNALAADNGDDYANAAVGDANTAVADAAASESAHRCPVRCASSATGTSSGTAPHVRARNARDESRV